MRSEQVLGTDVEFAIEELEAMVAPKGDGTGAAGIAAGVAVGFLVLACFC